MNPTLTPLTVTCGGGPGSQTISRSSRSYWQMSLVLVPVNVPFDASNLPTVKSVSGAGGVKAPLSSIWRICVAASDGVPASA